MVCHQTMILMEDDWLVVVMTNFLLMLKGIITNLLTKRVNIIVGSGDLSIRFGGLSF
jgi:hypothetical protein